MPLPGNIMYGGLSGRRVLPKPRPQSTETVPSGHSWKVRIRLPPLFAGNRPRLGRRHLSNLAIKSTAYSP